METKIDNIANAINKKEVIMVFCLIDELLTMSDNNVEYVSTLITSYLIENPLENKELTNENLYLLVQHVQDSKIDAVKEILNPVDRTLLNYNIDYSNDTQFNIYQTIMDEKIINLKKLIKEFNRMEKVISLKIEEYADLKTKYNELNESRTDQQKRTSQILKDLNIKQSLLEVRELDLKKKTEELKNLELTLNSKLNKYTIQSQELNEKIQDHENNMLIFELETAKLDKIRKNFYEESIQINHDIMKKEYGIQNIHEMLDIRKIELDNITITPINDNITVKPPIENFAHTSSSFSANQNLKTTTRCCICIPNDWCVIL
jgi:hypothetical protein